MVNQTAGAQDETVQFVGGIEFLETVKQTGNNVVSAGSLTT